MSTSTDLHAKPPKVPDRRAKPERRTGERRTLALVPTVDRRAPGTRRRPGDRRTDTGTGVPGGETAEEHVRNALQLLLTIVEAGGADLDDEVRRDLDAAIFRLHFAIERLQRIDP
jgi:hypothetical protein